MPLTQTSNKSFIKVQNEVLKVVNKYTPNFVNNVKPYSFEISTPDFELFVNISEDYTYIIEATKPTRLKMQVEYLFTLTDLITYLKNNVK